MANSQNGENILPHGNAPPPAAGPVTRGKNGKQDLSFLPRQLVWAFPTTEFALTFARDEALVRYSGRRDN